MYCHNLMNGPKNPLIVDANTSSNIKYLNRFSCWSSSNNHNKIHHLNDHIIYIQRLNYTEMSTEDLRLSERNWWCEEKIKKSVKNCVKADHQCGHHITSQQPNFFVIIIIISRVFLVYNTINVVKIIIIYIISLGAVVYIFFFWDFFFRVLYFYNVFFVQCNQRDIMT